MTSTSFTSFSDSVPEAFSCGGGESIAAIFFLFFGAKKLPKKPELSAGRSNDGLAARGGTAGGRGRPVLGSTWVGLAFRSLTIAIALTGLLAIYGPLHMIDARSGGLDCIFDGPALAALQWSRIEGSYANEGTLAP